MNLQREIENDNIDEQFSLRCMFISYVWSLWYSVFKQVDYFEPAQNIVHLKMIPRIDYTKKRGVLRVHVDVSITQQK